MATITLRSIKGSPLTNTEVDDNFSNINAQVDTKLNTTAYTAADVLSKLLTVDGVGSGLDADKLDGLTSASANVASSIVARDASGNFSAGAVTLDTALAITSGGTGANTAAAAFTALAPDQVGNTGKYLTTDGTSPTWATVDALPTQTGNTGKYLTTDGTTSSWVDVATGGAVGASSLATNEFIATADQTTFLMTYAIGLVEGVYRNGVKLGTADYTANNNTSIVLTLGATVGDLIQVVSFTDAVALSEILPPQAGNTGKYLTTNGTSPTWVDVESGNISTQGLYEHSKFITTNYTITTNNNAMSTGPITISTGAVVTVPSGSRWMII